MLTKAEIEALVKFSRVTSDTSEPAEVLSLLADAIVAGRTADAVAVFVVDEDANLKLIACRGMNPPSAELTLDASMIGDLTMKLLPAYSGEFAHARSFPFINEGRLFGGVVTLFRPTTQLSEGQNAFLEALVHFSAAALHRADQFAKLKRAYEELQRSQEALSRTEKLRALGQMAAVVAHDLINMLSPLSLGVQRLEKVSDRADKVVEIAHRMRHSINRGIATVDRLRRFSKHAPDQAPVVPIDLHDLLYEVADLVKPRLGAIELKLELEHAPHVLVAPSEVVAAVVNLIFNALDAMPQSGSVFIRLRGHKDGAQMEVEDTGPGIPDEIKSRLMEPFFTTKGEKGTGLGLASVAALAQRYGGTFTFESPAGKGATFRLWFPIAPN